MAYKYKLDDIERRMASIDQRVEFTAAEQEPMYVNLAIAERLEAIVDTLEDIAYRMGAARE